MTFSHARERVSERASKSRQSKQMNKRREQGSEWILGYFGPYWIEATWEKWRVDRAIGVGKKRWIE